MVLGVKLGPLSARHIHQSVMFKWGTLKCMALNSKNLNMSTFYLGKVVENRGKYGNKNMGKYGNKKLMLKLL